MIKSRIQSLQNVMKEKNVDLYMVPTADFHQSEYAGDYFKCRSYLSGFTGSAGTLVVTMEEAGLWTDGRYFIQAAQQLRNSGIKLFKMGEENVPTVKEYIAEHIQAGQTLGFDGRVVAAENGEELAAATEKKGGHIKFDEDLADHVWKERPALSKEPAFLLDEAYTGMAVWEKLKKVREAMEKTETDVHLLTSLDDIAWLFNMRGHDVESNPVALAYAAVTQDETIVFLNREILSEEMKADFAKDGIQIRDYDEVYEYTEQIGREKRVLLEKGRVNYALIRLIQGTVVDQINPTTILKAVKNPVEIENTKKAHIKDGIAFTKFMYWLKNNIGKEEITEISAAEYLLRQRALQEHFIEASFDTICAYKEHAAMMHYSADDASNALLKPEGLLLVDSGGQYFEGTTDITRTMALGEVPKEQKIHFTAVLKGMLNLLNARFLYGCRGVNLDILARGPVWELDIDYKCGTGHGVGHVLNVHEGPNGIRWRPLSGNNGNCILEEGMITTNEPGVYIEGSHGIRIENEMVCRKGIKNEHGQFMYFENITFAPIDLDAVCPELLSEQDKARLNAYHKEVYKTLSPYLTAEEKQWLETCTREI